MQRNLRKEREKTDEYLGSKIVAWEYHWEDYDNIKCKLVGEKSIVCHIDKVGRSQHFLNLGGCNDGSKFTAVNQAINQAKQFINACNEYGW